MRRVMLMVAAMAVMVSLFAVVAYAADINGSNRSEILLESNKGDNIFAGRGQDEIWADQFDPDKDIVYGNRGKDYIDVDEGNVGGDDGDGNDKAFGGLGYDECWGDEGDVLDCEEENGQVQLNLGQ